MKNKATLFRFAIILFLVALFFGLKELYLRPPVYFDISEWLYWIVFLVLLILATIFKFLKSLYWYMALGGLAIGILISYLSESIYGEIIVNLSFVMFIVCIILKFADYLKHNENPNL